jgi:hypothetical protein
MKLSAMMREPSAFLPVTMSLIALATLFVAFITGGLVRETDEGTAAHIWQLLMGGQIPIVAYFAIKWLPQAPREALYVLALQVGVALAALAPVYLLHLQAEGRLSVHRRYARSNRPMKLTGESRSGGDAVPSAASRDTPHSPRRAD